MEIRSLLINHLQYITKATITLEQLERVFISQKVDYETFANHVLQLEQEGLLQLVKSHGRNGKVPALGYQYHIRRQHIQENHIKRLHQYGRELHPRIQIDRYYGLSEAQWKQDWPFIEQINRYLQHYDFSHEEAPAPERSFELVGDEKWITEKGGQVLLERLGLWDDLRIMPVSDPLMLAVNPVVIASSRKRHLHLIVENKTTFQGLIEIIHETNFATLIYGCGRKIVGNLDMHRYQYPVQGEQRFYYFGDIDMEGIRIWYDLQRRHPEVQLALPFYTACFAKNPGAGKENQRYSDEALAAFLSYLPDRIGQRAQHLLSDGYYWPQETLVRAELESIWRSDVWNEK